MYKKTGLSRFSYALTLTRRVFVAPNHQQNSPSSISFTATSWRVAVVLKGSDFGESLQNLQQLFESFYSVQIIP